MPGVEVPMPQPRLAQNRAARILLAAMAFLIIAVLTASPGARAQQGHLIPPHSRPRCAMGYRILSPTAGVDLLPYLTTSTRAWCVISVRGNPNQPAKRAKASQLFGFRYKKTDR